MGMAMPLNVKNGWLGSFLLEMVLSDTSVPQLLFPTYQPTSEYCLGHAGKGFQLWKNCEWICNW